MQEIQYFLCQDLLLAHPRQGCHSSSRMFQPGPGEWWVRLVPGRKHQSWAGLHRPLPQPPQKSMQTWPKGCLYKGRGATASGHWLQVNCCSFIWESLERWWDSSTFPESETSTMFYLSCHLHYCLSVTNFSNCLTTFKNQGLFYFPDSEIVWKRSCAYFFCVSPTFSELSLNMYILWSQRGARYCSKTKNIPGSAYQGYKSMVLFKLNYRTSKALKLRGTSPVNTNLILKPSAPAEALWGHTGHRIKNDRVL